MKKTIKIWKINSIKLLENKFKFVIIIASKILKILISFTSIYILFNKQIMGKSYFSFIISLFFFLILSQVNEMIDSSINKFKENIVRKNLQLLIKPYSLFKKVVFCDIDYSDLILVFIYFPVFLFYIWSLNSKINYISIVLFLLLIGVSIIILISFKLIYFGLELKNNKLKLFSKSLNNSISINRFPFDIYPAIFNFFFTYIIPIGLLINIPVKIFTEYSYSLYLIFYLFFVMLLFLISKKFLKKNINNLDY